MQSIAVAIHRKNKKFDKALDICKLNKLWVEAIETVRDSNNSELICELLQFFLSEGQYEYYCAGLYGCYDAVTPDLIMEWNWVYPQSLN